MRIDFNISQSERGNFVAACEAVIRNVGEGTKATAEVAGLDIMSDSLGQVPIDTSTLIRSAFLGVANRGDVKNYRYGAILGYGDIRGLAAFAEFGKIDWLMEPTNGTNPKNNLLASAYAAIVHEDLDMPHPNGGKAKFLEDPVRDYAANRFARTVTTYWKRAIAYSDAPPKATAQYNWSTGHYKFRFDKYVAKIRKDSFVKHNRMIQRRNYVYKGDDV